MLKFHVLKCPSFIPKWQNDAYVRNLCSEKNCNLWNWKCACDWSSTQGLSWCLNKTDRQDLIRPI